MVAAIKAVKQPITARASNSLVLKNGYTLPNKNTPAATIVAAWMSADTDVGPSIASGSQVCNGNCADLAATAKNMPPKAMYCQMAGSVPAGATHKLLFTTDCVISPLSPKSVRISKVWYWVNNIM